MVFLNTTGPLALTFFAALCSIFLFVLSFQPNVEFVVMLTTCNIVSQILRKKQSSVFQDVLQFGPAGLVSLDTLGSHRVPVRVPR